MTKPLQYTQGDVFLEEAFDIPSMDQLEAVERDLRGRIVIAVGETKGHAHAIQEDNSHAILMRDKESGRIYLFVKKSVDLVHETHPPIKLEPKVYEHVKQIEYVPGSVRVVAD